MEIIRTNLLPKVEFILDHGNVPVTRVRQIEVQINYPKLLHLPHDTPLSFLHARPSAGGLGLISLEKHIEVLRERRRVRLTSELYKNDPQVQVLCEGLEISLSNKDSFRFVLDLELLLSILFLYHNSVENKNNFF